MAGNSKVNPLAGIFLGGIFLAVGLAMFFYWGRPLLIKSQASENWPSVSGRVKTSEVTQSRSDGKTMFSPNVVFEYKQNGRPYLSSHVVVGTGWSSSESSSAYSVTNKYPVGSSVEVYYDPTDPAYGVLETGTKSSAYFVYFLGLGFAGIGLLICVVPIMKIVVALFFIGSSLTQSKDPQSTLDSRFPEENLQSGQLEEATTQTSTQPAPFPAIGTPTSEIGDGITIQ